MKWVPLMRLIDLFPPGVLRMGARLMLMLDSDSFVLEACLHFLLGVLQSTNEPLSQPFRGHLL